MGYEGVFIARTCFPDVKPVLVEEIWWLFCDKKDKNSFPCTLVVEEREGIMEGSMYHIQTVQTSAAKR